MSGLLVALGTWVGKHSQSSFEYDCVWFGFDRRSLAVWKRCKPILEASGAVLTLIETTHANHAGDATTAHARVPAIP